MSIPTVQHHGRLCRFPARLLLGMKRIATVPVMAVVSLKRSLVPRWFTVLSCWGVVPIRWIRWCKKNAEEVKFIPRQLLDHQSSHSRLGQGSRVTPRDGGDKCCLLRQVTAWWAVRWSSWLRRPALWGIRRWWNLMVWKRKLQYVAFSRDHSGSSSDQVFFLRLRVSRQAG